MRILFIVYRYWPSVGGVESLVRTVATGLAQNHEVNVLAVQPHDPAPTLRAPLRRSDNIRAFIDKGVRVQPLTIPSATRAAIAPLLALKLPLLRRYSYGRLRNFVLSYYGRVASTALLPTAAASDIIHIWGGDLLGAAALEAGRRSRVPVAITPFAHPGQYGTGPSAARLYRKAGAIIALLETESGWYRDMGVSPTRITIIRSSSEGVKVPVGSSIREQWGIQGPLILFLAAKRPYKGIDVLLNAAPLVARHCPGVTFAFVGPGPPIETQEHHSFTVLDRGQVDDAERAAWLDAADVLCLPSEFEIFPISALEAWSVRTPVVFSSLKTLKEVTRLSGGGLTAERTPQALSEVLVKLLRDPVLLRKLGLSGNRFWKEHCQPAESVLRHEKLYAELMSN